jgi:hypothetical protein
MWIKRSLCFPCWVFYMKGWHAWQKDCMYLLCIFSPNKRPPHILFTGKVTYLQVRRLFYLMNWYRWLSDSPVYWRWISVVKLYLLTVKSCFIVGFLVVRHYEFMMHTIMREMYYDFLTNTESQIRMKIQVILHLFSF